MPKLKCKFLSALAGALVAGIIAIASLALLADFAGFDLLVAIIGIVIGGFVSTMAYSRLCKTN